MIKAGFDPRAGVEASLPLADVRGGGVDHVGLAVKDLCHTLDEIAGVFGGTLAAQFAFYTFLPHRAQTIARPSDTPPNGIAPHLHSRVFDLRETRGPE